MRASSGQCAGGARCVISRVAALVVAVTAFSASPGPCLTNTSIPCPPPSWSPTWNLTMSTIVNPGVPDFFEPPPGQPWGLVSLDWQVARTVWGENNSMHATVEATSREGCRRIKAASPGTRCFIYHNAELALQAFESQRVAMFPGAPSYDPKLFLRWPNGTIYSTGVPNHGPGLGYFWNYTYPPAREFFISATLASLNFSGVDGTFIDDWTGLPAEHKSIISDLNLTAAEVRAFQLATAVVDEELLSALVADGQYAWQAFSALGGGGALGKWGIGGGPNATTCSAWMRSRCTPDWQGRAVTQWCDVANFNESLASFLITRPPIGYFGFGWPSDTTNWRPEFLWDIGEPGGACAETAPGVFERPWTHGTVRLDCNTWTAVVPTAAARGS